MDLKTSDITPEIVEYIKQKLISTIEPEKIIIFGSYAKGNRDSHSDLDLFIITKKYANLRIDHRAGKVSALFRPRFFPMDVLVYTPFEIKRQIQNDDFFIRDILDNGKLIYERPQKTQIK